MFIKNKKLLVFEISINHLIIIHYSYKKIL